MAKDMIAHGTITVAAVFDFERAASAALARAASAAAVKATVTPW